MTWARSADDYAFFDNAGRPLAMAHRGGAHTGQSGGIENSMAAFGAAVALGFRYVETDVHATADGRVIAFHDTTLDRVTDLTGAVAHVPYDRVRRALIGGREPIPLLSDILASWPDLKVNIDCKAALAIDPLARLIAQHHAWDRVCVASFSPWRLSRLRARLGPRVATSYTLPGVAALRLLPTYRLRWATIGDGLVAQVPSQVGAFPIVTRGFVERAHALRKQVHVWTVDDPVEMSRLLDLGVDGIITDRADVLREVYDARGIWPGGVDEPG
ncbi:MAG: glycerophosphodiester phosphodiesterase family protein [Nocardioidaceae bacterium]